MMLLIPLKLMDIECWETLNGCFNMTDQRMWFAQSEMGKRER